MEKPSGKQQKCCTTLYLLMRLSDKAYAKYMQHKIYLYALTIRSANQKVYQHIIQHLHLLPVPIQDAALDLVSHYDIWMEQFRDFEARTQPQLGDLFVFHHLDAQSAYPRDADQKIEAYYFSFNNQKLKDD